MCASWLSSSSPSPPSTEYLVDDELQVAFVLDVDHVLPPVLVDLQVVAPDGDVQDLGGHVPLTAIRAVRVIPGCVKLRHDGELRQDGAH